MNQRNDSLIYRTPSRDRMMYAVLWCAIAVSLLAVFLNALLIGMGHTDNWYGLTTVLIMLTMQMKIRRRALATMDKPHVAAWRE